MSARGRSAWRSASTSEPILEALYVPRTKWWGVVLYTLFDIVRFPYTAIGWRYDLNHDVWIGPDTGNTYPDLAPASNRIPTAR